MTESIVHSIESLNKIFLEGPFGAGKTSHAIQRLRWLLRQEQVHGSNILVLTPQRTMGQPYRSALRAPDAPAGAPVQVTTIASLARRSCDLYWPLIAEPAGFTTPGREPSFLNLETSQYHMGPLVDEAYATGAFEGIRVERNRVISQVLDNLNKAALNNFTLDEAYARLESAIEPGQHRTASINALRSAKSVSLRFRQLCLEHNLVDYSLQIELFNNHVLKQEWSRTHLLRAYHHLVFDNFEEDTYTAHQFVEMWLPSLQSALLIVDSDGGLRAFLGASPEGAHRLRTLCDVTVQMPDSTTMTESVQALERTSRQLLRRNAGGAVDSPRIQAEGDSHSVPNEAALYMPKSSFKFYPQMIGWVAEQVQQLIEVDSASPDDIVILAPYLSDALKFGLQTELERRGVPATTHRPSRPLRSEPISRSLLTLASLAHPLWGVGASVADLAAMLMTVLADADPVRAHLLATRVLRSRRGDLELSTFDALNLELQKRITYLVGERYDRLRQWLYTYRSEPEPMALDHFWSRLFGELLSQPGFALHRDREAATVVHQLVTAAQNFRWAVGESTAQNHDSASLSKEFYTLVESGAIGALYANAWDRREDAVLIAPAYTFLMRNRAVAYQFWLDIGSSGWWERLYQPLTHPYVLSREWTAGHLWTDLDEGVYRHRSMRRLALGLIRRTTKRIYLGFTQYSESGYEQRGPLLTFVNRLLASDQSQAETV